MRNTIGRKILLSFALFLGISTLQVVPVYAQPTEESTTLTGPLQDLSVNDAPLSPVLSDDVTEYAVVLPEGTSTIEISATPTSGEATVSGTGTFTQSNTSDTYRIRVVDDGETTTYRISVTLSNTPVLTTTYEDNTLGFTVNIDTTTVPEGFSEGTAIYDGNEIRVWKMDSLQFQIVNLQDSNGSANWYAYQNGTITGAFKAMVFNRHRYFYTGVTSDMQSQNGCTYTTVEVQGEMLNGWTFDDADYASFYMLYLTDETGSANYYVYDTQNKTLVDRRVFESEVQHSRQGIPLPLLVAIGIIIVMAVIFAIIIVSANRKRDLKEAAQTIRNHVNPKKRKKYKKAKNVSDDVELVRTSKVKIYAQPNEPSPSAKKEVAKVKKEAHQKQVEKLEEKKLARTQELQQEKLTRTALAKKRAEMAAQQAKVKAEMDAAETAKNEKEKVAKEATSETVTKAKPVKKKASATKKAVKKNVDSNNVKDRFKRKEQTPIVNEPEQDVQQVKQLETPVTEQSYQEDPMTEIQRYIDQLFYSYDNKDQSDK